MALFVVNVGEKQMDVYKLNLKGGIKMNEGYVINTELGVRWTIDRRIGGLKSFHPSSSYNLN